MVIENLFPTAIGFFDYTGELDKDFLVNQPQVPNQGNTSSEDKYLLRHRKLLNLRQFIEHSIHEYFTATVNPKYDVRLKITQSWLNWSKPGQYHHKHAHPNSFISGCFYVNADKKTDKIYFFKDEYRQIKLPPADWNSYNSESWWYPVSTGQLVLFPSSLTHMVQPVEGDETRISLAFNTFPIGVLGDETELTALQLEK